MNILLHVAKPLNVNIPITLCCILSKYDYQINLTPIFSYDCFQVYVCIVSLTTFLKYQVVHITNSLDQTSKVCLFPKYTNSTYIHISAK